MTEAEWLASADPNPMLEYIGGRLSERKLRLFSCACCRRLGHLITLAESRRAIEVAERFADGQASDLECGAAFTAAQRAKPLFGDANWAAAWVPSPEMSGPVASDIVLQLAVVSAKYVAAKAHAAARASVATGALAALQEAAWETYDCTTRTAVAEAQQVHAGLLREIAGNPFQSCERQDPWPATVVALAESLYGGEDCAFALHDALLEANRGDLAAHFEAARHPPGCWVVDVILGKS